MQVAKHRVVSIHYTLTDAQDQVLDRSPEDKPLEYVHGVGTTIAGLEAALDGKEEGDHIQVTVKPEDAYGQHDDDLVQAVPRTMFQGVDHIEPGMQFQAETEQGPRVVTVAAVEDDQVTVDANHPLAGKRLNFDVQVEQVREASNEEIEARQPNEG